jgi:hypothetical protein
VSGSDDECGPKHPVGQVVDGEFVESARYAALREKPASAAIASSQGACRRQRSAKNGAVSYTFQVDVGTHADGTRDRQRFTFSTFAEARREYRKFSTEVAAETFVKRDLTTVAEYLARWLDGRRDVRANTLAGYRHSLKPVIDTLGGLGLQQLRMSDIDALVTLRLNGTPISQRERRGQRAAEVLAYWGQDPAVPNMRKFVTNSAILASRP